MDVPRVGFGRGRGAQRVSRARRFARSVIQAGRRRIGRGGVQEETAGQVAREAARAARQRIFRRGR